MSYAIYLGQFAIGAASKDFAIGATACAIATGNYYTSGYTSESTEQLCEAVQTKIRAIGATQDASTVSHSLTTNRVTITLETAAALTWTDTALGVCLGFSSASYSSATSFVAENPPRYTWMPTKALANYPLQGTKGGYLLSPRSTTIVGRSNDGTTYSVTGATVYDATLEYVLLPEADVITPTTGTTYRDFQQFWGDVIAAGKPCRIFPDRTLKTSTDYDTVIFGSADNESIGMLDAWKSRHVASYNGLWTVSLPVMKKV